MNYQMDDYRENLLELLMETLIYNNIIIDFPEPLALSPVPPPVENSLYERNPVRRVITDEVKKTLTPSQYKDAIEKENNPTCSITFESFQEEDIIIQLPCKHCFFVEAIMRWLTEESCECPVCRYKFDSMETMSNESGESPVPIQIPNIENHNHIYTIYNNINRGDNSNINMNHPSEVFYMPSHFDY
jgi:hypothetical protein